MEAISPSSLVEKARAFARTLASSQELEEYYSLQDKLKNDGEAQSLLGELEKAHQEMRDGMMQGKGAHDDLYVKIEALQDKIRANDTIMNWMRAEQIAISIIQEANEAISREAGFNFGQNASTNGGGC